MLRGGSTQAQPPRPQARIWKPLSSPGDSLLLLVCLCLCLRAAAAALPLVVVVVGGGGPRVAGLCYHHVAIDLLSLDRCHAAGAAAPGVRGICCLLLLLGPLPLDGVFAICSASPSWPVPFPVLFIPFSETTANLKCAATDAPGSLSHSPAVVCTSLKPCYDPSLTRLLSFVPHSSLVTAPLIDPRPRRETPGKKTIDRTQFPLPMKMFNDCKHQISN
jgi:hypothetical protein